MSKASDDFNKMFLTKIFGDDLLTGDIFKCDRCGRVCDVKDLIKQGEDKWHCIYCTHPSHADIDALKAERENK